MESVVEILLYWFLRITGISVFLWLVFRRKTRYEGAATAVLFCSMEISWILLKAASTVWADSVLAMAGFDVAAAGIFLLLKICKHLLPDGWIFCNLKNIVNLLGKTRVIIFDKFIY